MTNTLPLRILVFLTLVLLFSASVRTQPRRAMTPSDLLRVANVGDVQISPDGVWIVYTVTTVDGDGTRSTLWIARTVTDISQPALEAARPAGAQKPADPSFVGRLERDKPALVTRQPSRCLSCFGRGSNSALCRLDRQSTASNDRYYQRDKLLSGLRW